MKKTISKVLKRIKKSKSVAVKKTTLKQEVAPDEKDIITINDSVTEFVKDARKDGEVKGLYYDLLRKDYIYYKSAGTTHKFVKREKAADYFCSNNAGYLSKYGQLYATEINLKPKGMVVIFSSNPSPTGGYYDSDIGKRYLFPNFPHITKYIPDDVLILRIADLNRHIGTMYMPTDNYPDYDKDINKLISTVATENGINKEKILLLGASKGGTGAVYYGLKYNYNFIACDPILDIVNSDIDRSNYNFVEDCAENLVNLDFQSDFSRTHSYSICSTQVPENYAQNTLLKEKFNMVKIVECNDPRIKSHSEVAKYAQKWIYSQLFNFFEDEMIIR